jgi:colicin import membrane protein
MAKLKTFTTEQGFFELAVAAPSRAAALKAWGMKHDLFAQGLAKQSQDPSVMAAAEAKPLTVLRRTLGSKGPFRIEAELPKVKLGAKRMKPSRPTKSDIETERENSRQALDALDENYRRRLAALHKALSEVQNQIREVSREWKERQKQFKVLRPKTRR